MIMKIEGIPEGYELVRIGSPNPGETVVFADGSPGGVATKLAGKTYVIIRKIDPVCVWQHGVFKDGWITEDDVSGIIWHQSKPEVSVVRDCWLWDGLRVLTTCLATPPKFRDDLRWTERIQQVGPSVEGQQ